MYSFISWGGGGISFHVMFYRYFIFNFSLELNKNLLNKTLPAESPRALGDCTDTGLCHWTSWLNVDDPLNTIQTHVCVHEADSSYLMYQIQINPDPMYTQHTQVKCHQVLFQKHLFALGKRDYSTH